MTRVNLLSLVWQFVVCSCVIIQPLQGAFEYPGLGWAGATANIKVAGPGHTDRYTFNPALLDVNSTRLISLQVQKPFSGLDLRATSLATNFAYKGLPIITTMKFFGDDRYTETQWIVGGSLRLIEDIRLGVRVEYGQIRLDERISGRSLSISPSLALKIGEHLQLGSSLYHLIQQKKQRSVNQRFSMGLAYQAKFLVLLSSLEKEGALDMDLKLGILFDLGSHFKIAVGYQELSQILTAGWKVDIHRFSFYYTWQGHPYLPPSHGLGLDVTLP